MANSSRRPPNHYSLERPGHLLYLALGSAIGIGNLLILPSLMAKYGVTSVFLVHLFLLTFVSFPLVLAEALWSRWLLRPIGESFRLVPRFGKFVWALIIVLWIDLTPSYVVEYAKVLLSLLGGHWRENPDVFLDRFQDPGVKEAGLVYLLSAATVVLSAYWASMKKDRLLRFYRWGLALIAVCALFLFASIFSRLDGSAVVSRLMILDFSRFGAQSLFEITTYTLFSVSAGIGVYYAYVFYGSQSSSRENRDPFWQKSGVLLRLVARVFAIDLLFSILALLLLLPHLGMDARYDSFRVGADSPEFFALFLFPKYLFGAVGGGALEVVAYTVLIAVAGLLSLVSLVDIAYWSFDRELRMGRARKIALLSFLLCLLLAAPLLPFLREFLSDFGSGFLLPVAALCWSIAAGWIMPRRVQSMLLGRGPLLDGFLVLWRFVVRWALPILLLLLFVMRALSALGT